MKTFIEVANTLFINKGQYKYVTDEEKKNTFYIINKKCCLGKTAKGMGLIKYSQYFNNKYIDKDSALDIWYILFRNQNTIPGWWFAKSNSAKEKSTKFKITDEDKTLLIENSDLDYKDIDFLIKNYPDELKKEIKKLNKYGE